jgi:hypothetical protein
VREPGRRIAHRTVEGPNSSAPPVSPIRPVTAAVRQSWVRPRTSSSGPWGKPIIAKPVRRRWSPSRQAQGHPWSRRHRQTGSGKPLSVSVRSSLVRAGLASHWQPAIQEEIGETTKNPGQSRSRPPHCPAQIGSVRLTQRESGWCAHNLKTVVRKDLWVRVPRPPPHALLLGQVFRLYIPKCRMSS